MVRGASGGGVTPQVTKESIIETISDFIDIYLQFVDDMRGTNVFEDLCGDLFNHYEDYDAKRKMNDFREDTEKKLNGISDLEDEEYWRQHGKRLNKFVSIRLKGKEGKDFDDFLSKNNLEHLKSLNVKSKEAVDEDVPIARAVMPVVAKLGEVHLHDYFSRNRILEMEKKGHGFIYKPEQNIDELARVMQVSSDKSEKIEHTIYIGPRGRHKELTIRHTVEQALDRFTLMGVANSPAKLLDDHDSKRNENIKRVLVDMIKRLKLADISDAEVDDKKYNEGIYDLPVYERNVFAIKYEDEGISLRDPRYYLIKEKLFRGIRGQEFLDFCNKQSDDVRDHVWVFFELENMLAGSLLTDSYKTNLEIRENLKEWFSDSLGDEVFRQHVSNERIISFKEKYKEIVPEFSVSQAILF